MAHTIYYIVKRYEGSMLQEYDKDSASWTYLSSCRKEFKTRASANYHAKKLNTLYGRDICGVRKQLVSD